MGCQCLEIRVSTAFFLCASVCNSGMELRGSAEVEIYFIALYFFQRERERERERVRQCSLNFYFSAFMYPELTEQTYDINKHSLHRLPPIKQI